MVEIRWSPAARGDLERLYEFIAEHSEEAAARAIQTLVNAADTLSDFPEKGRPWEHDVDSRELTVRFGARGYVVRYRFRDNVVFIVRVWHAREDR